MEAIYLNEFLSKAHESKKPISVYTINGFPMSGVLTGYDSQCIRIEDAEEEMLIMYSAISTIKMRGEDDKPYRKHIYNERPQYSKKPRQDAKVVPQTAITAEAKTSEDGDLVTDQE